MGYEKNKDMVLKYVYDFSKQGGAVSAITLNADINGLKEGLIVRGISVAAEEALTSGGSATVTFGNTADPDGYLADVFAELGTAGASVREGEVAGALIWDDTNDHSLEYSVTSAVNTQDLLMTVGTAALTGGKLVVYLRCYNPGANPA